MSAQRQKDVHTTMPWIASSLCAISSNLLQLNGASAVNAVELEETLRRMDASAFPATTVYVSSSSGVRVRLVCVVHR